MMVRVGDVEGMKYTESQGSKKIVGSHAGFSTVYLTCVQDQAKRTSGIHLDCHSNWPHVLSTEEIAVEETQRRTVHVAA